MKMMRVVALLAVTSAVACWTAEAQTLGDGITVSKDNRTIAVTATDSVTVTADVATVTVGFVVTELTTTRPTRKGRRRRMRSWMP